MKKVFLFSLVLSATAFLNILASPIDSYQRLTSAMNKGERVVLVLNAEQISEKSGGMTLYLTPTYLEFFPATETTPEYVVFSSFDKFHLSDQLSYHRSQFFIYPDSRVEMKVSIYDLPTFQQIGQTLSYTMTLDQGIYIKTPSKTENGSPILLNEFAAPSDSYQRLTSAMNQGEQLMFVLSYASIIGKDWPNLYYNPNNMTLIPATEKTPEYVMFSQIAMPLMKDHFEHRHIEFKIYSDSRVEIKIAFYNLTSFKQIWSGLYTTTLDQGCYVITPDKTEKKDLSQ